MFRGRIKITGEIADFNTFKNKDGETMVQKDGTLSFFRPEEVENVEQLGWHPASELPPLDENGSSDLVYALGKVFSKEFGEYIDKVPCRVRVIHDKWAPEDIEVEWWCYPPRKEE